MILFFLTTFNSWSQKYYDLNDFEYFIDFNNMYASLKFQDYEIKGEIEDIISHYGNRYTGQNRATGTVFINNPTKIGDQITFNMITAPTGNFSLNKLGYNFPIGRDGMRGTLSFNQLKYKIGKDLKTSPQSKGDAFTYKANVKYPLLMIFLFKVIRG